MSTAASAPAVHIEGLRELVRALRAVDAQLPKEVRVTHREVAKIITTAVHTRAQAMGGIFAKVATAIQAGGDNRGGYVRLRPSKRIPMIFGAEFGAKHDVERQVRTPSGPMTKRLGWNHLPDYRGNQNIAVGRAGTGFIVYPTIREKGPEIVAEYQQRLDQLLRRAGAM